MKSLVIIPTYNEKDNIINLIREILVFNNETEILIIDDNSPDGTGTIADELAARHSEIHVLHRKGKRGLGTAYVEGFKYALTRGADYIFEMDSDFSHHPRYLPQFLETIQQCDLVLGSRYARTGRVINRGLGRLLLSKIAAAYVRLIMRLPVTDATGGFKCFKKKVLCSINLNEIRSNGYSFQIEMNYRVYRKGFTIKEIPIVFEERKAGESKMNKGIILEALWVVLILQFEYLFKRFIVLCFYYPVRSFKKVFE
ncbi:MAG: polyprenol monophosphomannose synthase [Candidatus Colwellbacteria bacterium]|nr:polyprenol monophosphomannose synthase [Candidatus Colwellbacteria bacterium]